VTWESHRTISYRRIPDILSSCVIPPAPCGRSPSSFLKPFAILAVAVNRHAGEVGYAFGSQKLLKGNRGRWGGRNALKIPAIPFSFEIIRQVAGLSQTGASQGQYEFGRKTEIRLQGRSRLEHTKFGRGHLECSCASRSVSVGIKRTSRFF
jgi:hypothetical protein